MSECKINSINLTRDPSFNWSKFLDEIIKSFSDPGSLTMPIADSRLEVSKPYTKPVRFPTISHVQFSLKTEGWKHEVHGGNGKQGKIARDENGKKIKEPIDPILATVVYFSDGSKVIVKNSKNDPVEVEDYKFEDGTTVKVATKASKERAIMYAIFKRLCGTPDKNGNVTETGLGAVLNDIIKNADDVRISAGEARIAEAARKRRAEELKAKPKKKRYSIAETLSRVNELLDKAEADPKTAKNVLETVTNAFKD